MLERTLGGARKLSKYFAWVGGIIIIMSALLVSAEVILRKLFNFSFGGADELSGYALGIAVSCNLAFALFHRAHIRVDATYALFPRTLQTTVNFLGLFLLIGFAGIVTWTTWGMVADTLTHGSRSITPLHTPLALVQIPWLIGWIFCVISGVLITMVAVRRMFKGDHSGVDQLIAISSINEQIKSDADRCSLKR